MASHLPSIWRVPAYLPYVQTELTEAAIADAEASLGVKLPVAYLDLLRVQNGGYLRRTEHARGNGPVDVIAGIGPRFPSITEHDWTDVKDVMADEGFDGPSRIDELIAFCGDGHYYYCFDYRRAGCTDEPGVTFIDVETFDVDELLAPDFATFLSQLTSTNAQPQYGITSGAPAFEVAGILSKATGYTFVDTGDQDSGYRIFRAELPGNGGFAWLSANRTRRGFVRTSDPEYATLSTRLREEVLRVPEHPNCDWFLSCTDFTTEAGVALVRSLADVSLPTCLVSFP